MLRSSPEHHYSKPQPRSRAVRPDKKITRTHYKDSRRNGDFQRDLLGLLSLRAPTAASPTIVGKKHPSPSSPISSALDLIVLKRGQEPFNFPLSGKGRDADGLPAHDPAKSLDPGPWRDQHHEIYALCYHLSLKRLAASQGRLVAAVTVRLRDDLEAKARAKGYQCTAWLNGEFARKLERAFGYRPDFWFTVEEEDGKDMHIHCEIVIEARPTRWKQERHFADVRRALRRAAGEWPMPARKFQVEFKRNVDGTLRQPDAGWVGYICKGLQKSRPGIRRFMRRLGADHRYWFHNRFEGSAIACTRSVSQGAELIYDELAKEVIAYRASL